MAAEKKGEQYFYHYLIILLIIFAAIAFFYFLREKPNIIGFVTWNTSTQESFNLGTYTNTSTNSSNVLFLNNTEYSSEFNDSSMVFWLHLNNNSNYRENGSIFKDFSEHGNNGSCSGLNCPAFASGKFDGSYSFDGTNDYITVSNSNSLNITTNITFSAWIYPTSFTAAHWMFLLTKGFDSYSVYLDNNPIGRLTFYTTSKGELNSLLVPSLNQWNYIAIVINSYNTTFYLNGNLEIKGNGTTGITSSDLKIGNYLSGINNFNGTIDEVAVWNRSLSADEIQDLYKSKKGTYLSPIKDVDSTSSFTYLNFSTRENSSLDNITFQVSSCNNATCIGATFVGYDNTTSTYFNLTQDSWNISFLNYNRYFQWKAWLNRGILNPQIVNVSAGSSLFSFSLITLDSITSGLTSGENATVRANITDTSAITSVWFTINDTSGVLTNYTMSREGSTVFYNATFEVKEIGTWHYNIYSINSWGNENYSSSWTSFQVSKPSATPQNEAYPSKSLPLYSIRITGDLTAVDLLNTVNATLNIPSGFAFLSGCAQIQNLSNLSASETKTATWFVSVPNAEANYALNISYYDKYNNNWNSSNFYVNVKTNLGLSGTIVDITNYGEVDAGNYYVAEISVKNETGEYVNASSTPEVTLIDPLGDVSVGPTTTGVTNLGTGRYNYSKLFASSATGGEWQILANVSRNGNYYQDREYFKITSGPFDVRNISITDRTIPSLSVSVILENQGGAIKDMYVEWNLTRADTDLLLDSGADTVAVAGSSTKTHSVSPSTSYLGEVKITFLGWYGTDFTESAGAFETFTTTEPPSSATLVGGGSGAPQSSAPQIIKVTEKEGKIEIAEYPEKIGIIKTESLEKTFEVKNVGNSSLNNVKLAISGLPLDSYTITPEKYDLISPGETKSFAITFKANIEAKDYTIKFLVISDEGSEEANAVLSIKERKENAIQKIPVLVWAIMGIILIFIIALAIILWMQKKLREQLKSVKKQLMSTRTKQNVLKDISPIKKDLNALETMKKDNLIRKRAYIKNRKKLNYKLSQLKKELKTK